MGRFLAMLEERLLPGGRCEGMEDMEMKTGEEGLATALRVTVLVLVMEFDFGESPKFGRCRLRIAEVSGIG
tara:strand:+ start:267 stop:479 length:213 start_codon:yes stop_codon:yes gene_type:complete